jgi:glutaredoxin
MYIIYTREACKYCDMAKAEMKRLNIEFKEIPQNEATTKELNEKLMGPTSFTYPQIFDGDHDVGGFEDLLDYTEEMVTTGAAI